MPCCWVILSIKNKTHQLMRRFSWLHRSFKEKLEKFQLVSELHFFACLNRLFTLQTGASDFHQTQQKFFYFCLFVKVINFRTPYHQFLLKRVSECNFIYFCFKYLFRNSEKWTRRGKDYKQDWGWIGMRDIIVSKYLYLVKIISHYSCDLSSKISFSFEIDDFIRFL